MDPFKPLDEEEKYLMDLVDADQTEPVSPEIEAKVRELLNQQQDK